MDDQVVIAAEDVSKKYLLRHNRTTDLKVRFLGLFHPAHRQIIEEFWAVRNVSLTIRRGEVVGIIGRNGSGKSTFLRLIAGLQRPTSGRLLVDRRARMGTMIELGVGFHPELTGRENVRLSASIYGISRREIDEVYPRIVKFSGLEHFMDQPIKNYSSGMRVRLGFAIAAQIEPEVLLLDEVFAVGDLDFQKKCMAKLQRRQAKGDTILFVSHSARAIAAICSRVCVLDAGRLVFDGDVTEGLAHYEALAASEVSIGEPSVATV